MNVGENGNIPVIPTEFLTWFERLILSDKYSK